MSFIRKSIKEWNVQSIIVSLCVLGVCIGTQQMQTARWDSAIRCAFENAIEVWMAIIILSNCKLQDFLKYKKVYIAYSVVGVILSIVFVPMAIRGRAEYLFFSTLTIALGMFLMGFCVIHVLIDFFVDKYRPKFYLPLLGVWVVMLLLMIFSKSDYIWPERYFLCFLCYYMTKQTREQRSNVIKGCVDGIILGFFAIQAHALLCRPYDIVRYCGNFCNPNHNGLFLCFCLVALLAKILFVTKENAHKAVRGFWYLMAGACYSLIFMTICRSGYIAVVVVTIFFLIAYCKVKGKQIFIRMGTLLVGTFVVMMPVTYLAVRYVPTIHPHVLFYFQEGYSEERVHSWDSRDSEKYVSFTELMSEALGRFVALYDSSEVEEPVYGIPENEVAEVVLPVEDVPAESVAESLSAEPVATEPAIAETENAEPENVEPPIEESRIAETDPDKIPALESETNAFLIRYTIYKWYFTHLSLRGMPYDEQGFQLTKDHWIQDTHNIYLDYGINFGYPVMILFAVFIWWGIGRLVKLGIRKVDVGKCAALLIVLVPPVFGMFEFAWGAGMLATVVFYICFKEMFEP